MFKELCNRNKFFHPLNDYMQYCPQYFVTIFLYSTQLICYTFTSFWLWQNHRQWKISASRVAFFLVLTIWDQQFPCKLILKSFTYK